MFVAIFTVASWRFIDIPEDVVKQNKDAQLAWVQQRCHKHYVDSKGVCLCFGDITAYEWRRTETTSVLLDTTGAIIEFDVAPSLVGHGSLSIGNKTVEVSPEGDVKVDAAKRSA